MASPVLLDNDVVLKTACYSLAEEALVAMTREGTPPAMLGVGRYVVLGRIKRDRRIRDSRRANEALTAILESIALLEPNEAELAIAADFEAEANRRDLELDGGESQLLAILESRSSPALVTGDKRAIIAIAAVAMKLAAGRIGCLEQLMAHLTRAVGLEVVRARICAEPDVDRAISICFGCARDGSELADVMAGLTSYIGHLSKQAPGVLVPGDDLSRAVG